MDAPTASPPSHPLLRLVMKAGRSLIPNFSTADEEFKEKYRAMLFGQYRRLDLASSKRPAATAADDVIKLGCEAQWEDLYLLEATIIDLESESALRRRAWTIRNEYKEVASAAEFKDYLASNPPDPATGKQNELRADTLRLLDEMHWRYLITWTFEEYRASLTKAACRLTLFAVIIAFCADRAALALPGFHLNFSLILNIVTAGLLGGLISTLRRIHQAKLDGNADLDLAKMLQGSASVYISPVLGATFAFLLFLLFAGKLADGGLFPKVSYDLLYAYNAVDLDGSDYAKLTVWSFIAGFAESFVPDKLSRLASDSSRPEAN